MSTLTTSAGSAVVLGEQIGSPGGEGTIYAVSGKDRVVAKIYHAPIDEAKRQKLLALIEVGTSRGGFERCGLPVDVLSKNGVTVGFLLPFFANCREWHELSSPVSRRSAFPSLQFDFLVHTARNLVVEVGMLHDAGLVIGDVNSRGFLVSSRGLVHVIDCDSFQVRHQGRTFRCEVGMPDYLAPELHTGATLGSFDRTQDHDRFAVAVLLFQMLFQDRHPYFGVPVNPREAALELPDIIKRHRFAYGARAESLGVRRPPHSLPLSSVPLDLQTCFEEAFAPDAPQRGRPSMARWQKALDAALSTLRECPQNKNHIYFRAASSCPWCDVESAGGPFYFSGRVDYGQVNPLTLISGKERLQSLLLQYGSGLASFTIPPQAVRAATHDVITIEAGRRAWLQAVATRSFTLGFFGLIAAMAGCSLHAGWAAGVIFLGAMLAFGVGWFVQAIATSEQLPFVLGRSGLLAQLTAERDRLQAALALNPGHAAITAFRTAVDGLRGLLAEFEAAQRAHDDALRALYSQDRDLQLLGYLDGFSLLREKIPQIGQVRLTALSAAGVVTAGHIRRGHHKRVTGITAPASYQLEKWSQYHADQFRYNPKRSGKNAEVDAHEQAFARTLRALDSRSLQLCASMRGLRERVVAIPPAVEREMKQVLTDIAQISADIVALQNKKF